MFTKGASGKPNNIDRPVTGPGVQLNKQRGGNNKMSVWRPGEQQQQPAAPVVRQEEEIGLDEEAFGVERLLLLLLLFFFCFLLGKKRNFRYFC